MKDANFEVNKARVDSLWKIFKISKKNMRRKKKKKT